MIKMKLHNWLIIFLALFFLAFVFFEIVSSRTTTSSITQNEIAHDLAEACYDAAKTIKAENYSINKGVWRNQADIETSLDVFYRTLSHSFAYNPEIGEEYMKEKTPIVMFIDIDGFYVSYNAAFDQYGNAELNPLYREANVITDINTWSVPYGNATVRYYLTDYIDVTTPSNVVYSGRREEVVKSLNAAGALSGQLSFLQNEASFEENKSHAILQKCEDTFNYFLNTQKINVNQYLTGYNVTFTETKGESWQRMITNPTIVAFFQGNQAVANGNFLNEYAFAAGELTYSKLYFIEGNYYYSLTGNQVVTSTTTITTAGGETFTSTVYTHNGVQITKFYTSAEECAALGAVPAPGEY